MKQQVRAPVMIICGIDPGLTGAISRLDAASGELADVVDMPVFELAKAGRKSKTVDAYLVADLLGRGCGHVFVEVQQTRPGPATQAVSKTFTGYGIVLGVIAALKHHGRAEATLIGLWGLRSLNAKAA
jgi:hypothetical protein